MQKYDLEKVVGEGSFGKALLCRRKSDNKRCIIKQIALRKMSRKEAKQTEQESTLLARLQHPNIVSFWEAFHDSSKGCFCIVMEFADGGDLSNYIKARKGRYMSESQLLQLFVQICLAMKHVHDRKILHRDLKPGNIFLTSTGMVKLGDFGIARVLRNTGELASTQIGTPYFMSPEQMENKKYSNKSDIWSLGCVLYEMACLKVPFDGSSMKQLIQNILNQNPAPLPSVFSKELRDLAREALTKSPRDRPSINSILSKSVVRDRIKTFLNETLMHREFSHTILHGHDVMTAPSAAEQASRAQVVAEANARLGLAPPGNVAKPIGIAAGIGGPVVAGDALRVGARIQVPGCIGGVPAPAMGVGALAPPNNHMGRGPIIARPGNAGLPPACVAGGAAKLSPRVDVADLERIRAEAKRQGLVLGARNAPSPRNPGGGGAGAAAAMLELERIKREAREKVENDRRAREREQARQKALEKEREKQRELEKMKAKAKALLEERERDRERVERERAKFVEKEKERMRIQREREKLLAEEREREEILAARRKPPVPAAVLGRKPSTPSSVSPIFGSPRRDDGARNGAGLARERSEKRLQEEKVGVDGMMRWELPPQQKAVQEDVVVQKALPGNDVKERRNSGNVEERRIEAAREGFGAALAVAPAGRNKGEVEANKATNEQRLAPSSSVAPFGLPPRQRPNESQMPSSQPQNLHVGNSEHTKRDKYFPLSEGSIYEQKGIDVANSDKKDGTPRTPHEDSSKKIYEGSPEREIQFVLRGYIPSEELHAGVKRQPLIRDSEFNANKAESDAGLTEEQPVRRNDSEPSKGGNWLADLQDQMGALRVQVQNMKARSPRPGLVGEDTQNVLQIAGKHAALGVENSASPRPSPRNKKAVGAEALVRGSVNDRPRIAPRAPNNNPNPAAFAMRGDRDGKGLSPRPVVIDAPVEGPRKAPSQPVKKQQKAEVMKGKIAGQAKNKPKAPTHAPRPKPKPKDPEEAAEILADRRKQREESRNELREFLKQQRQQQPVSKAKRQRPSRSIQNRPEWVGVGVELPVVEGGSEGTSQVEVDKESCVKISENGDDDKDDQFADEFEDDTWEEDEPGEEEDEEGEFQGEEGEDFEGGSSWGSNDDEDEDTVVDKEDDTSIDTKQDALVHRKPPLVKREHAIEGTNILTNKGKSSSPDGDLLIGPDSSRVTGNDDDDPADLSQMETRLMGDMKSAFRAAARVAQKHPTEAVSDSSTNIGISFGSDELLSVAEPSVSDSSFVVYSEYRSNSEKVSDDASGKSENGELAMPVEEEILTEEAALEFSRMLQNMQQLLEQGDVPIVDSIESTDAGLLGGVDEFDEEEEDRLHMSAIMEIDFENDDDRSVSSARSHNDADRGVGGRGKRGAARRYGRDIDDHANSDRKGDHSYQILESLDLQGDSTQSSRSRNSKNVSRSATGFGDPPLQQPVELRSRRASLESNSPRIVSSQSVPNNLRQGDDIFERKNGSRHESKSENTTSESALEDASLSPDISPAMTIYGVKMPLTETQRIEMNVSSEDTYAERIESIRLFLEKKLGLRRFVKAYRLLKSIQEQEGDTDDHDEDALLTNMEEILGPEKLKYLDLMFQLITIEEKFQ